MAEISAQQVKELRNSTGAPMMDAKVALTEANGDIDQAMEILTRKGLAKSEERADREATDGLVIALLSDDNLSCSLIHLGSETDFSAKAEDFIDLGNRIAQAVLKDGEGAVDQFQDELDNIRLTKKENIELKRAELITAGDGNILDVYVHQQDGRGINAVIVEGSGVEIDTLHQVSLHISFAKPVALTADEIPQEEKDAQRKLTHDRASEQKGKPENVIEKIAEGLYSNWLNERVLLEQGLHGDKIKVKDTLGNGSIVRFLQAYIR